MGKRTAPKAAVKSNDSSKSSYRSRLIKTSALAGACVLLAGGGILISSFSQAPSNAHSPNNASGASNTQSPGSATGNTPTGIHSPAASSERTVTAPLPERTFNKASKDSYSPPPSSGPVSLRPSSLSVPSVGISATMVKSGAQNGAMVLPDSSEVAEYSGSAALTDTKGSTVIAGHVNFTDGSPGALGSLHQVEKGAPIYATDAKGKPHKYRVVALDVLKKQALPYEIFRTAGKRQLVIVTCGGGVETINGVQVYGSNVVVTAEPVV